jgi:hypothetical protein
LDENDEGRTVLSAQDARTGNELGVMRYVLYVSLALTVLAGVFVFLIAKH